jgi:cobalamin biosynthesis protein CobT
VLGKRAPFNDPRLFQKKRLPGKRSYAVLLGIDISGSTIGVNIALAKKAAYAQSELCNRLGIDFAVYAHSATPIGGVHQLDMYCIKDFDSPWDKKAEEALLKIGSWSENLDGHSLEYYRKRIENVNVTDKIIL